MYGRPAAAILPGTTAPATSKHPGACADSISSVSILFQVKIADFGVARMIEANGHMTAETGTYRWMAPEVIEHKPYDEKADVFSFGVVLWELLTCKVGCWMTWHSCNRPYR
eukprot:GHUV01019905.1.p2 GENE.GHUV01019905.1~~GHUV01019905.1.p2  ORF type:complete len:111 (+),score=29.29 GHUV01019905.1:141-473(+)